MEGCGPLGGCLGSLLAEEQDGVGEGVTFAETHHHYPEWSGGEEGWVYDCCNVCMHPCLSVCVCVHAHGHTAYKTSFPITNFVSTAIGYTVLHRQQSTRLAQYMLPLDHQNRKITKSVENTSH